MVGGGWYEFGEARAGVTVGGKTTVCNGEIAGIKMALKAVGCNAFLIWSDFRASIMAVKKADKLGIGRTRGLKMVVSMIEKYKEEHGPPTTDLHLEAVWVLATKRDPAARLDLYE